jgi:hypothetical protein
MVRVNAHFDGKFIIPDEPVDLPLNQPLVIRIEPRGTLTGAADQSVLSWLAANAIEADTLPADLADRDDRYSHWSGGAPGNHHADSGRFICLAARANIR